MNLKQFNADDLNRLQRQALGSKRLRANYNFHPEPGDPIQRFFNALEPGSYIRPHRHVDPPKWELMLAVRGSGVILLFDEDGRVNTRSEIHPSERNVAIEIPAGVWHTLTALQPGSVFFELKPGPYAPFLDKDFAIWSPPEGTDGVRTLESWFHRAGPGDYPPGVPPGL